MSLPPSCLPPATCPARLLHFCRLGVFSVFYNGFNENDSGFRFWECSARVGKGIDGSVEGPRDVEMVPQFVQIRVSIFGNVSKQTQDSCGARPEKTVAQFIQIRAQILGSHAQSRAAQFVQTRGQNSQEEIACRGDTSRRDSIRRSETSRALRIATWTNYGQVDFEQRGSARRRGLGVVNSLTTTMAAASPPPRYAYLHADGTGLKLLELERPSPAIRAASAVLAGPAFFSRKRSNRLDFGRRSDEISFAMNVLSLLNVYGVGWPRRPGFFSRKKFSAVLPSNSESIQPLRGLHDVRLTLDSFARASNPIPDCDTVLFSFWTPAGRSASLRILFPWLFSYWLDFLLAWTYRRQLTHSRINCAIDGDLNLFAFGFFAAFGTLTGTSFRYIGSSDQRLIAAAPALRASHCCGYNTWTRNCATREATAVTTSPSMIGLETRGRLRRRLAALLFGDLEHF
ncbi:hypothetical protein BDZ89DRAFT_1039975 [Hymenopellis radicata]|nr:hypothetical protein BDZ89DRAFT_1039975 [Hymenopellis radicata]